MASFRSKKSKWVVDDRSILGDRLPVLGKMTAHTGTFNPHGYIPAASRPRHAMAPVNSDRIMHMTSGSGSHNHSAQQMYGGEAQYYTPTTSTVDHVISKNCNMRADDESLAILRDYDAYMRQKSQDMKLWPHVVLNNSAFAMPFHEHQEKAIYWMRTKERLHLSNPARYPPGGILADDMGLGKSLTSLALVVNHDLSSARNIASLGRRPQSSAAPIPKTALQKRLDEIHVRTTLVICPKTLINEWMQEISKQVVNKDMWLRARTLHGNEDARTVRGMTTEDFTAHINKYNVVIANYHFVQNNIDLFERVCFFRIIMDEAHQIKNQKSQGHQNLSRLQSLFRWCLTGSPINNNIADLYSLMVWLKCKPYSDPDIWKAYIDIVPSSSGLVVATGSSSNNGRANTEMKPMTMAGSKRGFGDVGSSVGGSGGGGGVSTAGFFVPPTAPPEPVARTHMIRETILRRTKEILNLRKCNIVYVDITLTDEERKVYDFIWEWTVSEFGDEETLFSMMGSMFGVAQKKKRPVSKKYMKMLEKLLRVRQCCNHMTLVDPLSTATNRIYNSADTIIENLVKYKNYGNKKITHNNSDSDNDDDYDPSSDVIELYRDEDIVVTKRIKGAPPRSSSSNSPAIVAAPQAVEPPPRDAGPSMLDEYLGGTGDMGHRGTGDMGHRGAGDMGHRGTGDTGHGESCSMKGEKVRTTAASRAPVQPQCSAKIAKIVELVERHVIIGHGQNIDQRHEKCVIFSQWTSVLDIIQTTLEAKFGGMRRGSVSVLRIDGSQSTHERSRVQTEFKTQHSAHILLASTMACSLGLNLQVASMVIIVEPWYNPQVERQAIDRVYRFGQEKDVDVFRLIAIGTFEERVKDIQGAKNDLALSVLKK